MAKEKEKFGVGSKYITNEGYEVEIVEIVEKLNNDKRKVRFKDGYEVEVFVQAIRTGQIKNPYHPSVFGVGYFGIGDYKAQIYGKATPEYTTWVGILERCYNDKRREKNLNYKNVTVCEEWLNFQNFAKWYRNNHPGIEVIKFQLDKDLLQQGVENKIYSPETCILLPHNINAFLANKHSDNTSGYIGVSYDKVAKKWRTHIRVFLEGEKKYLGYFSTPEEASIVYQLARAEQAEKVKSYLRSLNYLPETIINLIK